MNRRKAIIRGVLAVTGVAVVGGGYETFRLLKAPDLVYLDKQRGALAALAETIIPATDGSPGGREAGVADFIIRMVRDCTERTEQNSFISGLKALQERCVNQYGLVFEACEEKQREEILAHSEASGRPMRGIAGKIQTRLVGRSFFSLLKDYTVEGYCTSEAGATKGLAYLSVPGSYSGCIPLKPGQKAWATE